MPLFIYHLILPAEGAGRSVLLRRQGSACALPRVEHTGDWLAQEAEAIRAAVRRSLGLDATVLRQLRAGDGEVYAEIEGSDPGWQPPADCEWAGAGDLATLPEEQRRVVEAWLGAEGGGAPWERRGWLAGALAWIDERLAAIGLARQGPIRQVKAAWAGSAVLAARTAAGDFYFKASAGTPGEARVLRELAPRWGDRLPVLVAAEPELGWTLTHDFAGEPLPPAERATALRRFADMQVAEAARLSRWRQLGCLDRSPAALARVTGRTLEEIPRLLAAAGAVTAEEVAELARFRGHAEAICRRLDELGPSLSIHLEDCRDGNIVLAAAGPLFFDWVDTVISHPFFSAQRFLDDVEPPPGGASWDWRFHDGDPRSGLRDAYLQAWEGTAAPEALREAFELTRRLEGVYQLVRYDAAVDLEAWLAAGPPAAELELAHGVLGAVLAAR
jgi:hypothetical protein